MFLSDTSFFLPLPSQLAGGKSDLSEYVPLLNSLTKNALIGLGVVSYYLFFYNIIYILRGIWLIMMKVLILLYSIDPHFCFCREMTSLLTKKLLVYIIKSQKKKERKRKRKK